MYKKNTFLAVIPARGGSKGIPGKNIVNVQGKPLIEYTIDAAKESKYLDQVIVSTDDDNIKACAINAGAEVPFIRPAYLATDTAKTIDVLIHAVNELKKCGESYDFLVLLQPTQPLRKSFHIDEAIVKMCDGGYDNIVSVSPVSEHPILMRKVNGNDKLSNLLGVNSTVRRQDFLKVYKVNGAIYINKIDNSFNQDLSLNDNKVPYFMNSKYDLDIDSYRDLKLLDLILAEKL
ncbi:acylneuraminate cytidylyltransferase family protein [Aciduricibacillus chroicocephali]|uniref:Acylneuraminate cytidylyltransferase family protein n=1 Tax=Aciduricibacillus chroicocephali TaxID=3054939 RepID=A0ABY9KY81_9BACI|nr:acylneuraminate cytidylyltransferase family protein [Bacillaceae bacterium 44XB]